MKTALVILLSLATCTAALADITLVRDGQPQVFIVVPEGLYKHVQKPAEQLTSDGVGVPLAAVELADYLGKICGTRPQIATESQKGLPEGPRPFCGALQGERGSRAEAGGDRDRDAERASACLRRRFGAGPHDLQRHAVCRV